MFPWGGKLNYKRISEGWAIKRCYLFGKPLPIMRFCRAMVWALPNGGFVSKRIDGVSAEEQLTEIIDAITRGLQKDNPDIRITGIRIERNEEDSIRQRPSDRRQRRQ